VSKSLLFNTNSAIFQQYPGENKLDFNEMMVMSALQEEGMVEVEEDCLLSTIKIITLVNSGLWVVLLAVERLVLQELYTSEI
jgi:hypothetical protein